MEKPPFSSVFCRGKMRCKRIFSEQKIWFQWHFLCFYWGPNSWCWEGRGGRRLEGGEGGEEAGAAGCGVLGGRSTRRPIPASICTGHWHLGRPWPQEGLGWSAGNSSQSPKRVTGPGEQQPAAARGEEQAHYRETGRWTEGTEPGSHCAGNSLSASYPSWGTL